MQLEPKPESGRRPRSPRDSNPGKATLDKNLVAQIPRPKAPVPNKGKSKKFLWFLARGIDLP